VAITAQLVYAPADRHLWAQSYERDLRYFLSMQREVAEQIAYEVQAKTVPNGSRPTAHKVNPGVYEDYVMGRYAWENRSKESLFRALTYFQRALDKDPNFALAYAGEAEAYVPLAGLGLMPPREYFEKAKAAATRAIALDDSLAEAHSALGAVLGNSTAGRIQNWNSREPSSLIPTTQPRTSGTDSFWRPSDSSLPTWPKESSHTNLTL
jgi:hypothetical protein